MTSLTQRSESYDRTILIEDQPLDNDHTSFSYNISTIDMASMQFCWSGADTKKVKFIVEVSNNNMGWCSPFPDSLTKTSTVGSGCCMYTLPETPYAYIRGRFVVGSNTAGTVTCTFFGKRRRANHP